ncbi:MAG TPA: hypothetical protein VNT57_02405 [Desulfobacteria bacterium]|nr:hypothetical protein [Desulfobacteria bacterium]
MTKGIAPSVSIDKCKACLTCVLICSLTKEGSCNPSLARIHVSTEPKGITFRECDGCLICTKLCAFGALGKCES